MFEEILSKQTKSALAVLGKSGVLTDAYLAGGTALALEFGHRISVDLDFFIKKKFDENIILRKLKSLPLTFRLERSGEDTILGYVGRTRFSLFFYDYPLLAKTRSFLGVNVADARDIAPMKVAAISSRGTKRDFVDLYFIVKVEKKFTLAEVIDLYDRKFKALRQNEFHILKSLTFFDDAEKDKMPKMIQSVQWGAVKKFFEQETERIGHTIIG